MAEADLHFAVPFTHAIALPSSEVSVAGRIIVLPTRSATEQCPSHRLSTTDDHSSKGLRLNGEDG